MQGESIIKNKLTLKNILILKVFATLMIFIK